MRHGGVPSRPRRQRRPPRPAVPACLRPAGLWVLRRRHADVPAFLDAAAPALLVAQAIGRGGNYFNQELFGRPSDLPWAGEIDVEHRPARDPARPAFPPTFLYEAVWNLLLAGALVWLGRHRTIRPPGLFALYMTGYCAFRIIDELLRVDPAAHVFGVRWNLLLAIGGTVAGAAWFAAISLSSPADERPSAARSARSATRRPRSP